MIVNKDYTFIYSSASEQYLRNLINEFLNIFYIDITFDDIFYTGVFCKPQTYVNFDLWDELPPDVDIPDNITSLCPTPNEKMEYVRNIMSQIMRGEIRKPSWMVYVEMELKCTEYELAPSTFLYIEVKDSKYQKLANALIDYLYSPNLLITMIK